MTKKSLALGKRIAKLDSKIDKRRNIMKLSWGQSRIKTLQKEINRLDEKRRLLRIERKATGIPVKK